MCPEHSNIKLLLIYPRIKYKYLHTGTPCSTRQKNPEEKNPLIGRKLFNVFWAVIGKLS